MEEEYPDELVDDEENNGSVAEEVLLDDKGEDPLGEKGELGREAEHTVIEVELTSTDSDYTLHRPVHTYIKILQAASPLI